jgi:hypothetical protein
MKGVPCYTAPVKKNQRTAAAQQSSPPSEELSLARQFGPPVTVAGTGVAGACRLFITLLARDHELLAVKSYRVALRAPLELPIIPCLDHEATIHERTDPHISVYLRDRRDALHELTYYPEQCRIVLPSDSTLGDYDERARRELHQRLVQLFPECRFTSQRLSWLRADRRVAQTTQAHAPLREVLLAPDLERIDEALRRLSVIATLIEKNSRVSSWSVRTAYSPLVAAFGLVLYLALHGAAGELLSASGRELTRYGLLAAFGALLVYFGLRAVHLTQIGARLWKRAEEYRLIVQSRRRREHDQATSLLDGEASRFTAREPRGDARALKAAWIVVSAEHDPQLVRMANRVVHDAPAELVSAWRAVSRAT